MANYIREQLLSKYEFLNFGHALEILSEAFPNEWQEIQDCLEQLVISTEDITSAGGNETAIPKKFDDFLYPRGWKELRITGDLLVKIYPRRANQRGRFTDEPFDQKIIEGYIDGHNIDFIKGRVAFDLEWNSKDQTFDRDLMAMRSYYESGIISMGVIITRGSELCSFPAKYNLKKYGASSTWLKQLTERLDCRRAGGCPILAIGITPKAIKGYNED